MDKKKPHFDCQTVMINIEWHNNLGTFIDTPSPKLHVFEFIYFLSDIDLLVSHLNKIKIKY